MSYIIKKLFCVLGIFTTMTFNNDYIYRLNEKYAKLSLENRIRESYKDFSKEDILITSSFASNSSFLLHLYSNNAPVKPRVYFIDTFYHFDETLEYKNYLSKKYNLEVYNIIPDFEKHFYTRDHKLWQSEPDKCCFINKVEPLDKIKSNFKIWASGLMRFQNYNRRYLNIFEFKNGILRFYPIIDVSLEEKNNYIKTHKLDTNPLVNKGYNSIGCSHCTKKGTHRDGRWVGLAKTECGLHI